MNLYKKYFFIYFIALPVVLIPIFIYAEFRLIDKEKLTHRLQKAFNRAEIPVLFMGDSVTVSTSKLDTNKDPINRLLQDSLRLRVFSLNHAAYSSMLYKHYIKLLKNTKNRPKVVTFGLNIRVFSPDWYLYPTNQFRLKQIYVRSTSDGLSYFFNNLPEYFKYRFLNEELKQKERWEQSEAVFGNLNLGPIKKILDDSFVSENIDASLDTLKFKDKLDLQFKFHYMNIITRDHPILKNLLEIKNDLDDLKIKLLIYITPINYQDGEKYVGSIFKERIEENRQKILNFFKNNSFNYIDMLYDLDRDKFIDKHATCAHVNQEGRKYIADKLARKIEGNLKTQR